MKKWANLFFAVVISASFFTGCNSIEIKGSLADSASNTESKTTELTGTLKFAGSSSMANIMASLGEEFHTQNPGVTFTIDQQGSGSAILSLNDGTAQIGNLSRKVKEEENAEDKYEVITMANDGINLVVNRENTISNLTIDQIAKIFKGEIANWKDVGGSNQAIYVVGREEGSGTRDGFEEIIKAKGKCKYGVMLKETGDVVSKVASEKAAIGYISLASLNDNVKSLDVNGIKASDSTISDGSYKLQRPFVQAYRKGTNDELILAYLKFLKTDKAKELIRADKLIPVQ